MTTSQIITIPWNVIAVCALYAHLWAANDAYIDLLLLRSTGTNGALRFLAKFNMSISLGLGLAQVCFLLTGVVSFFGPDPAARYAGVCLSYIVTNGIAVPSTLCLDLAEALVQPTFSLQAVALLVTIVGAEFVLMSISFGIVFGRRHVRQLIANDRDAQELLDEE